MAEVEERAWRPAPSPRADDAALVRRLHGRVERRLAQICDELQTTQPLRDAIIHSLIAPSKRLRPLFTLLAAVHFGGSEEAALEFGCAVELVHTASLVLDDLPSMDDAALRRGRPTAHVAYGEDMALLAAMALLNESYALILRTRAYDAALQIDLSRLISDAIGVRGLVTGQARDLRDTAEVRSLATLMETNRLKTSVLFSAAVEGGARIAGASPSQRQASAAFAEHLGLAYQLCDDLIDANAASASVGKDVRRDAGKRTLVDVLGQDGARQAMTGALAAAKSSLAAAAPEGPLFDFADHVFEAISTSR